MKITRFVEDSGDEALPSMFQDEPRVVLKSGGTEVKWEPDVFVYLKASPRWV